MKDLIKWMSVYYYTILIVLITIKITDYAQRDCCEKTAQAVYEYEGLIVD